MRAKTFHMIYCNSHSTHSSIINFKLEGFIIYLSLETEKNIHFLDIKDFLAKNNFLLKVTFIFHELKMNCCSLELFQHK